MKNSTVSYAAPTALRPYSRLRINYWAGLIAIALASLAHSGFAQDNGCPPFDPDCTSGGDDGGGPTGGWSNAIGFKVNPGETLDFHWSADPSYKKEGKVTGGGTARISADAASNYREFQVWADSTFIPTNHEAAVRSAILYSGWLRWDGTVATDFTRWSPIDIRSGGIIVDAGLTLGSPVTGSGALNKRGEGVFRLLSVHNNGINLEEGTLEIASTGGTSSWATLASGTVLRTQGGSVNFDQLTGSGALDLGVHMVGLTPSQNATFDGAILGSGLLSVNAAGGVQTITTADLDAGLSIANGTLRLGSDSLPGSYRGDVTLASPGILELRGSQSNTLSGAISGTGTLRNQSSGLLEITGHATHSNTEILTGGLLVSGQGSLGGSVTLADGLVATLRDQAALTGELALNGNSTLRADTADTVTLHQTSGSGQLEKFGSGIARVTGALNHTGGTSVHEGTLALADGVSFHGTIGLQAGTLLDFAGEDTFTFTAANGITGAGGVQKSGTGDLIVLTDMQHTGGTHIQQGRFQIGDGGTNGSITGNMTVDAGATLAIRRSNAYSLGQGEQLSGAGQLVHEGSGYLLILGDATHTGGTTVNGGWLQIGNFGGTPYGTLEGNVQLNNPTSGLIFARSTDYTFSGDVSGVGKVVKWDPGTVNVTGDWTHTGGTTVMNYTLQIGDGGTTGSIAGDIALEPAATLRINRSDLYTFTAEQTLSGGGALKVDGPGEFRVLGDLAHTGGTTISQGRLQIGDGGTSGSLSGDVEIQAGAQLVFNRSDNYTLAADQTVTGAGQIRQEGSGTLIIEGNTSHTGGTFISGGNIQINNGSLTRDLNVQAGGTLSLASPSASLNISSGHTASINGQVAGSGSATIDGTLKGSGTLLVATTINGIHTPGNSPGIQTFGSDLTYNTGASVQWELIANTTAGRGTNFDGIDLTGTANLVISGATTLDVFLNLSGSTVDWNDAFWNNDRLGTDGWLVFQLDTGSITNFSNLSLGTISVDSFSNLLNDVRPNASFSLIQDGNDIWLNYAAIPEPNSALLLGLGVALVALHCRRRQKV